MAYNTPKKFIYYFAHHIQAHFRKQGPHGDSGFLSHNNINGAHVRTASSAIASLSDLLRTLARKPWIAYPFPLALLTVASRSSWLRPVIKTLEPSARQIFRLVPCLCQKTTRNYTKSCFSCADSPNKSNQKHRFNFKDVSASFALLLAISNSISLFRFFVFDQLSADQLSQEDSAKKSSTLLQNGGGDQSHWETILQKIFATMPLKP